MHRPIYPWLLSVFPILHLYSENLGIVTDLPVLLTMGVSLATTTLFVLGLRYATASLPKAALITSLLLFGFYYYGHLSVWLGENEFASAQSGLLYALFAVIGVLAAAVWLRPAGATFYPTIALALNVALVVMLAPPTFATASYFIEKVTRPPADLLSEEGWQASPTKVLDGPETPDIYYIIADGYSSNEHLLRDYHYDNSAFTNELEKLGFYVTHGSKANYGSTLLSLASSLNMRYVPEKPADVGVDDLVYLRMAIADNAVARFLLARGYSYIYMLSGFLLPSRIADVNLDFGEDGVMEYAFSNTKSGGLQFNTKSIVSGEFYKEPFTRLLVESSLLRLFADSLEPWVQKGRSYHLSDPKRLFATLEELKRTADKPEATFTFVHLLKPHGPLSLTRFGDNVRKTTWNPTLPQFFDELEFVNEILLDALLTVIEKSDTPPIIILQADHGSDRGNVWTKNKRLTHFEILQALYLPESPSGGLPLGVTPNLSPINSFGVLLRAYFGADYEEQEVKLYDMPGGYDAPFGHVDVTNRFQ